MGRLLARKLGFNYLDTGVMYRAMTWLALERAIRPEDHTGSESLAQENPVEITNEDSNQILIAGHHLSDQLRSPEVNQNVSAVSMVPGVRRIMVQRQQALSHEKKIVSTGRDSGTVVLPDADLKIYLTAIVEERTVRRLREFLALGQNIQLDQVIRETEMRDHLDSTRADSPLIQAKEAWLIDTTHLAQGHVVQLILSRIQRQNEDVGK